MQIQSRWKVFSTWVGETESLHPPASQLVRLWSERAYYLLFHLCGKKKVTQESHNWKYFIYTTNLKRTPNISFSLFHFFSHLFIFLAFFFFIYISDSNHIYIKNISIIYIISYIYDGSLELQCILSFYIHEFYSYTAIGKNILKTQCIIRNIFKAFLCPKVN